MFLIRIIDYENSDICNYFPISVDEMDYPVIRIGREMVYHEFKRYGVVYEAGVEIKCGDTISLDDSYHCGHYCVVSYFKHGLDEIDQSETDLGCQSDEKMQTLEPLCTRKKYAHMKNVASCRETANIQLKIFNYMAEISRYSVDQHRVLFLGKLPFIIEYDDH